MNDFHCHLDLYPNAREVYQKTLEKNVFTWLVTTSPRAYAATSRVLPARPCLLISPGLHPEIAGQKSEELDMLLDQISATCAIGEVGLDGSLRHRQSFEIQQRIFSAVIARSAELNGRVLSIHSRMAAKQVLDTLEKYPSFGIAILHWFTDSPAQLRRAIQLNCWFSVGPAMLTSANGRQLAALMPRDRVVPESDGPFAKMKGVSVMPWDAANIADELARLWGIPIKEGKEKLAVNAKRLVLEIERLKGEYRAD